HRHQSKRMLLRCPQDLAAKDIADSARDLLIEKRLGDRGVEVGVPTERFDSDTEVGGRVEQVGSGRAVARMAMGVELAVRLDCSRTEAHGCKTVNCDADP